MWCHTNTSPFATLKISSRPASDVAAVWVRATGGASGSTGRNQSEEVRAAKGVGRLNLRISQAAIDKLSNDARRIGCSRAKLVETLIAGFR